MTKESISLDFRLKQCLVEDKKCLVQETKHNNLMSENMKNCVGL